MGLFTRRSARQAPAVLPDGWSPDGTGIVGAGDVVLALAKRLKAMGQAKYQTDGDPRGGGVVTAAALADAVTDLAARALEFAAVNRTSVYWSDQKTPESDTDHTVMLAWIAPALAALLRPDLDTGLVTQFAVVHDAVEVFAGDTPTLRIDDTGRAAKAAREAAAVGDWDRQFGDRLPWISQMIYRYELQKNRRPGLSGRWTK